MLINDAKLNIWHYLLLAVVLYVAFYFGLASYPLANNNEGLYAEVAREMLATGNYIIPHLNFVPYIEKPPLLYWLIALSDHLLGVGALSARLIPALSATSICLGLVWFGKKINQPCEAWLASFILATSLGFIIIGRIVFFDMLLSACLAFSLLLFFLWHVSNKVSYLRIAYVFLALGVLTKGLICLVFVFLITTIFLIINRESKKILKLLDPFALFLFFAIVLPWHILANIKQPGFIWDYFVNEQFLRFLNERQPHDYYTGPIYYYIPRLAIYLFPWTLLTPILAYRAPKQLPQQKQLQWFLGLWFLIPLVFFSISEAKANYYMIVGVPPLAYLLSIKLKETLNAKRTGIFIVAFAFYVLFAIAFYVFCNEGLFAINLLLKKIFLIEHYWSWLLVVYCLSGLFVSGVIYKINQALLAQQAKSLFNYVNIKVGENGNKSSILILYVAGITLLLLFFASKIVPVITDEISEVAISNYVNSRQLANHLYIYEDYAKISTLLFYVAQRLPIIHLESPDLYYGAATPAAKGWFLSEADFMRLAKVQPAYVAFPNEDLADFHTMIGDMHFCVVAKSAKAVLMSNVSSDCDTN